jgi:hypothetical protein
MAANGKRNLIAVVDIGSWKISALIAVVNDAGELEVLGTGQRESRGVRRGFIADMERTEMAIRETVEQAERVAGSNIEDVWVGFSGGNLVSDVVSAERVLGGYRVEQSDIDDLLELGRDSIDPAGKTVLHAQPACYTINGNEGVRKPEGMHADRLGVDIHVVMADGAPLANMEACVRSSYLNVNAIVAAPVATGMACLSEEERDLGVALVEMGAGVTNVSVYAGGGAAWNAEHPDGRIRHHGRYRIRLRHSPQPGRAGQMLLRIGNAEPARFQGDDRDRSQCGGGRAVRRRQDYACGPGIREPRITVIGVGGAGGNAVNNMIRANCSKAWSSSSRTPTRRR